MIQVFRADYLAEKAEKQHNHVVELEPRRGTIYDRDMRALALNVGAYSLYVNPKSMTEDQKSRVAESVAPVLGVSVGGLATLMEKPKHFVWLARKVPQDVYEKINAMKLRGAGFVRESKRFYPSGEMAAHVIGFANIDNIGLQGVELEYDKYLRGEKGMAQFLRDARQRDLLIEKDFVPARDGYDVVLTIDETIQFIAEKALDKAYTKYHAKGATVIVMDPKTGEILAFANRPTFSPAKPDATPIESKTNRAVAFVYEPGSVFKIVTASAALEEKAFNEDDVIFCENGKYWVATHYLKDHEPHGNLTFRKVVEYSSNIGFTKIAQKLGADKVYEYARRFRFGMKTNIGMVGEVNGMLKPVSKWSKTSIGAIPIGQEVTVTPPQLLGMIGAVANDGTYMKPYYIKSIRDEKGGVIASFQPQVVGQVISKETARRLKPILQGVVDEGTATAAKMKDITAGGKTGTAQKVEAGGYSHSKFVASFIGFAPVEDPKLAIVVSVDEPHPIYYGGLVSAPVFKEIVEDSLRYLATKKGQ
ncbi:MAG: penicillin-binding protein [Candidatus Omnitrophica bacterium]|nr:penicillin-binding protein [Candidatus Omnitrophota bacterium]